MSASLLVQVTAARDFPANTCPASRHAQIIGEALLNGEPYPMLHEDAAHCGASILATVASLYEARTEIARLQAVMADACIADLEPLTVRAAEAGAIRAVLRSTKSRSEAARRLGIGRSTLYRKLAAMGEAA